MPDELEKKDETETSGETLNKAEKAITDKPPLNDERIDQILEANQQLQQRVDDLEVNSEPVPASPPGRTWNTVPEKDLEYVVTHPNEYPDHVQAAFSELRTRDRDAIKSEMSSELQTQGFMDQNKAEFDPNTPIGKEVAKIMGKNRNSNEVLSDVIELAKFRTSGNKADVKARKKVVTALQDADAHTPGSGIIAEKTAPSFIDMPKDDFENEVQKIKLKTFQ